MKSDKNNTKAFITLFIIIIFLIIARLYHYGSFDHPMKHMFDRNPKQTEAVAAPEHQKMNRRIIIWKTM